MLLIINYQQLFVIDVVPHVINQHCVTQQKCRCFQLWNNSRH